MLQAEIQLDDRRFEELVDELKRRIPRYTPEWTDHAESDPGIALIELFAWLTEMTLYRLNRVPEKNYLAFLDLIGLEPTPPEPARTELTFTLTSKDLSQAVLIPQGTRVALSEAAEDGPVIFETEEELRAVGAELAALQSFDGARFKLLGEEGAADAFFYPLGESPQAGAAFYLGFDRALPPGRHRLMVHAYTADLVEQGQGVAAPRGDALEAPPPVLGRWEYWAGDDAGWRPLAEVEDHTVALTRSGELRFEAPSAPVATRLGLLQGEGDDELFWLRFRVEQELGDGYEIAPRLEDVLINTVPAIQALSVRDELLGASSGLPNQRFRLTRAPILAGTLVLEVDEGEGFLPWTEVEDFAASDRESRHYVLDLISGEIAFGDGERGKIPLVLLPRVGDALLSRPGGNSRGDALPNIRAVRYRWGGGARGNAGAGTVTELRSSLPFVDSVTNLRPATGGEDLESVESAKARAPSLLRHRSRAVTAADFEDLARQTPGARIRRARALALHHPDLEPQRPAGAGLPATSIPVPGVVTVVVVPDGLDARPMPSADTLSRVAAWLRDHSLVTTEIYAAAPRYREIEIEARVVARPEAGLGEVQEALIGRLLDHFHPLVGGEDGAGWAFGGTVSFAEVYRLVLEEPGVLRLDAESLKIFVDGELAPPCTDIDLEPDEMVTSSRHVITVTYGSGQ